MHNNSSTLLLTDDDCQWIPTEHLDTNSSKPILSDVDRWKPLERFVEEHDQFQLGQLRWLLRDRKGNGLDKAVRKIGKRIYIHDQLFGVWMLERTGNK
jgi:hypothetical protein